MHRAVGDQQCTCSVSYALHVRYEYDQCIDYRLSGILPD